MKLRVANLMPNHFDKGLIDDVLVKTLEISLKATGLDGVRLVARMHEDDPTLWEIDDGKHSLVAIKQAFGPNTMVNVEVKKLTDTDLFLGWLHKNFARRTIEEIELKRIVITAEEYLIAHPEICPIRISSAREPSNIANLERTKHKCPRATF
jgi:hypothetical protein